MDKDVEGGAGGGDADDGEQGKTPPAKGAEHQDDPGKNKDRSDWIPRARFDEVVAEVTGLKNQLAEVLNKDKDKTPPVKEYTRAELLAFVESGDLKLEQADAVWERQIVERATKAARETAAKEVSSRETTGRITAEMRRYRELVPAAWNAGSEERAKVAEEFRALTDRGMPATTETELVALRSVFGAVEKLEKARSRSKPGFESDQQSGAGGGSDAEAGGGGGDPVKGLTAREREHYSSQIKAGRYKDWDAVREELKYANPALRRKMGART